MTWVLAWTTGALLGAAFFCGLSWTVHRAVAAKRPGAWFLGSLLLRMSVTMIGFYFVSGGHWQRLLSCLDRLRERSSTRVVVDAVGTRCA